MLSPLCLEPLNDFTVMEFIQQIHMERLIKVALWLPIPGIDAGYRQDSKLQVCSQWTEQVKQTRTFQTVAL